MNHELSITFSGRPDPIPGAVPAAAEGLLTARDHGETGFPDAPRDRTAIDEITRLAKQHRERFSELVVVGEEPDLAGIRVLAAAFAAEGGIAVRTGVGADAVPETAAYLFVAKGREPGADLAAYEAIRERLREQSAAAWRERVVIITDPARGALREEAARAGVATFNYPVAVSGPESILTPVGLLPAAGAGADLEAVLDGARAAQDRIDAEPFATNPAQLLAAALASGPGWRVPEAGPARLRETAGWLRLLLAAHLGGAESADGVSIHVDPEESPEDGIVIRTAGNTAALIQTLLTGVALAGRAMRGEAA